jgi:hypothetical protein
MNDELCSWCRELFLGDVEVAIGRRVLRVLKPNVAHHATWDEMRSCGESECIICAALWLELPERIRNQWLEKDMMAIAGK